MTTKEPTSMEECIYFTNRIVGKGKVKAWVFKEDCPECKKAKMGKPRDPKTGKPKIRSTEYVCSSCNHTISKAKYEPTLTLNAKYTCPHCQFVGETQVPFHRKKVQFFHEEKQKKVSADAVRFACEKCGKNIDVTKKMK